MKVIQITVVPAQPKPGSPIIDGCIVQWLASTIVVLTDTGAMFEGIGNPPVWSAVPLPPGCD